MMRKKHCPFCGSGCVQRFGQSPNGKQRFRMDPCIHATTNALEGWHSRIKRAYRQHAGLSQRHKIQFLKWYSYFENQQKTTNP